jgi:hypothetical protein
MYPQLKRNSILTSFALLTCVGLPGWAHTVKVAQDVAVTLHIEPNHQPRAGEPAQAWFVLTQVGGAVIPLAACHCQLSIYQENASPTPPMLQPSLKALSAERYAGVTGATIVFPDPGVYQLELEGTPKTADQFQPFQVRFPVTVATGSSRSRAGSTDPQPAPQQAQSAPRSWLWAGVGLAIGLGMVGFSVRGWHRQQQARNQFKQDE